MPVTEWPGPDAPPTPAPVSVTTRGGLRVHAIQTGWVQVKRSHRTLSAPLPSLRLPAILLDGAWTPWLPILCYAVEHPEEGVLLVDAGETAAASLDPDHFACTAGDRFFYTRNLRFAVRPEDEAAARLLRLGIDPASVRRIVMTHLHSDHAGGLAGFPRAEILVSRTDADGHLGALMCRLPPRARRVPVEHDGPAVGAFARSRALTRAGDVVSVPAAGHTPGHQAVLVRDSGGGSLLLAGDAAFDLGQVERGEVAGIVADVAAARSTLALLRAQAERDGTVLLFAHDPEASARLRSWGT